MLFIFFLIIFKRGEFFCRLPYKDEGNHRPDPLALMVPLKQKLSNTAGGGKPDCLIHQAEANQTDRFTVDGRKHSPLKNN